MSHCRDDVWPLLLLFIWLQAAHFHSLLVELNTVTKSGLICVLSTTRSVHGNTSVLSSLTPWFTIPSPWNFSLTSSEKWACILSVNAHTHTKDVQKTQRKYCMEECVENFCKDTLTLDIKNCVVKQCRALWCCRMTVRIIIIIIIIVGCVYLNMFAAKS